MTLLHQTFTQFATRSALARKGALAALVAAAFLVLSGCAETGQLNQQPRFNPLSSSDLWADGVSARPLVAGAVPFSAEGQPGPDDPALTGVDESGQPLQALPVEVNQDLLAHGQEEFEIYCRVCHGSTGEGTGQAVTFGFPKPPSLLSDEAKQLSDGQIFAIIRDGQGDMFPYGYRVKAEDRWAVVAYIRAMQMKDGKVDLSQLTDAELQQIGSQP